MTRRFKIISSLSALICLYSYGAALTSTHSCNSEICNVFSISKTQMSVMFMVLYLGFFFASVLMGSVGDKKGKLPIICLGTVVIIVGSLILPWTKNLLLGMVAMACIGLGGGACETCVTGYIGDTWKGKRRNTMMNFNQTAFGFGAFSGPVISGFFMRYLGGYRGAFLTVASVALCGAIVVALCLLRNQEKPSALTEDKVQRTPWIMLLRDKWILGILLCLMLYMGVESGFSEWVSVYYEDVFGMDGDVATQSVGIFWLGLTLGSLVFGILSKRLEREKMVIASVVAVIVCWIVWYVKIIPVAYVGSFWVGFFLGPVFGTILGMGTEKFPRHSGAVTSILFGGGYIGGAFFPALIGINADRFGVVYGICIVPILVMALLFIFSTLIRTEKEK